MAIISYEFTVHHFPFFSQSIPLTKRKAPKLWHKKLRKKRYELFTYFNNYLFMLGQLSLKIESFPKHCGKLLNQMNSSYHMAFIIWRGPSYHVTLQTPPTQTTVIISVSVKVLMKVFVK